MPVIKKYITTLIFCLLAFSLWSNPKAETAKSLQDSILFFAKKHIGKPYQYGSAGPHSFDCSGFTSYVMKNFGYDFGRSSRCQIQHGMNIEKENAQPGDLIFFTGAKNKNQIGHVGIILSNENNRISFIHSSTYRGVVIDQMQGSVYDRRFRGIKRVLPESKQTAGFRLESAQKSMKELEASFDLVIEHGELSLSKRLVDLKEEKPKEKIESLAVYRVKKGDTLYEIAKKNRCSVEKIKKTNHLKTEMLSIGQKLSIPQKG